MSAQDRAIQKLARDLASMKKELVSWRGPQADYTSLENSGNFTFKDSDGNVTAVVGGQDDGSNTIRHVDGPTPPIPSGLSAHVDGPIIQVSWDGSFEDGVTATHDWHYLEVLAVGPSNEQLTGTIDNADGGSTSLAATSQGDWVVVARSVSRAGKRSLDGDAGTVAVQLVGLTGAIDAIQESANGKNTIYYSPTEPTPPELGFNNGDLWFDTSEEGNNQASVWDGNGWVSMEDARLATIIAAQEALEADLTDVQTSVDGKNKITYDPALPPASYVGAVGDTWYRTSGNSMIGFWKWDGAEWVQQALSTTVIPQIDIGAGTFGSLKGSRLEVGSVSADKVLVGNGAEMMPDEYGVSDQPWYDNFDGGAGTGWSAEAAYPGQSRGVVLAHKPTGTSNMSLYTNTLLRDHQIPAQPGETYQVFTWVYATGAVSGFSHGVSMQVYGYNNGAYKTNTPAGDALTSFPSGEWVKVGGAWTAPAGIDKFSPRLTVYYPSSASTNSAKFYIGRVSVKSQIGATLIENGAITTDKIAVGSITAESGIIESLDLGTATVGELDGIRIMGQTVRGEQLSGDAIDGKVITGPTIQSARTGQRWVGDTTGIRIFNADNELRTQLSPDGSTFKGEVEADTLVVNGGSELRSTENKLAQGAKLTLAAGVTDPTAPPMVQPYWDSLDFEISSPYTNVDGLVGLAYDGTHYWSAHKDDQGVRGQRARIYAVRIDPDAGVGEYVGGNLVGSGAPWSSEVFGVTCVGSELFWLGRSLYDGVVWVTDLAGEFKRAFASPDIGYSATNTLTYRPGIGNDGANLVIAQCNDAGTLVWKFISKTDGSDLGGRLDRGDATKSDITGVYVGNGDLGTKYVLVAKKSTNTIQVFGTDGSATNHSWYTESGDVGIVFHDGTFHTLNPAGKIHEYADTNTGDNSGDWWATYRWSVDVDEDGINDSVSRIGPVKRFTWPRRGKLKFLGAPLPVGAGYITPSIAKKATKPSRTDFRTPVFVVHEGTSTAMLDTLPTDWLTGASPSDVNSFPNAEPSTLASSSGTFKVQGDGSGRWGPLTFNADGTVTGPESSGQTVITPPAANTVTSVEVTFPVGRFKKAPEVSLTPYTGSPHQVSVGAWPISRDSFTLNVHSTTTDARRVGWQATDSQGD